MQEAIINAGNLKTLVSDALSTGASERAEREQREARQAQDKLQRLIDAAPERARATLDAIPEIARKAAASSNRSSTVCVMWLEPHEYQGRFSVDNDGSETLVTDPALLQYAGKQVFECLTQAELRPEIRYGYKPAEGNKSSPTHMQVGIHIPVS